MGRTGIDDIEDLRGLGLDGDTRQALLESATECVVCYVAPDGHPAGVVMSFLAGRERLWLTAVRGRAHVRALTADPRVSVVISSAGTALPRQMLALRGTVTVHDDRATLDWFLPAFATRMNPQAQEEFVRLLDSPNRLVLEVSDVTVAVSHDSSKMAGDGRGGAGQETR